MDDAEQFMPNYLRFVRGLIDSSDLPLNVSREILQDSTVTRNLRNALTKRVLQMLEKLAKDDAEKYQTFWQQFGLVMKEGPAEDHANQETIAKLMAGELDARLVYRKRLRRPLSEYQRNVPPHVRAARLADEENQKRGRPLQYQNRGTIKYVWTTNGPEPLDYQRSPLDYEHYLTRQLQPVAEGILPFIEDNFATLMTGQLGLF